MAKIKKVNLYSIIEETTDTFTKHEVNGWSGLVSEVLYGDAFYGTIVYFPGVTFKQLKAGK